MFKGCTNLISNYKGESLSPEQISYNERFKNLLLTKTLAESCYANMFEGCKSLTTIESIESEILAPSCYANMFKGCTGLTEIGTIVCKQ